MLWWILSIASVVGVVLNIFQNKLCFWIWAPTNGLWIIYNWRRKAWPLAGLFAVYFVLAIWGILAW